MSQNVLGYCLALKFPLEHNIGDKWTGNISIFSKFFCMIIVNFSQRGCAKIVVVDRCARKLAAFISPKWAFEMDLSATVPNNCPGEI